MEWTLSISPQRTGFPVGSALTGSFRMKSAASCFSGIRDDSGTQKSQEKERIREMLRALKESDKKAEWFETEGNRFTDLSGSEESDTKKETEKPVNYSYKEVAMKIRSAKTSESAAQALLSARRKVLEIKRKISSGSGDPEELQIALTHAKRMEMAARRKKHHLELEEMTKNTIKADENADNMESAAEDMRNALVSEKEDEIIKEEDEVFEDRKDMISDITEGSEDSSFSPADKMSAELNEMISEFGEEELKELEESMEMLENMEVINPHMSEDDFNELKRKHRFDEEKSMVKADMDYLKDMIKLMVSKGASTSVSFSFQGEPAMQFPVPEGIRVDVQL